MKRFSDTSFITSFAPGCKHLRPEFTLVSQGATKTSRLRGQAFDMGLAGLDQVEQAGGVQRELAGQALGCRYIAL